MFSCVSLRTHRRSNTKLFVSVCYGSLKCSWTTEELKHKEASMIKHCYWLGSIFSFRTRLTWASGTKLLFHKHTQTHTVWCLWWRRRRWNHEIKRCSYFDLPIFLFWCFFYKRTTTDVKKHKNGKKTFDVWRLNVGRKAETPQHDHECGNLHVCLSLMLQQTPNTISKWKFILLLLLQPWFHKSWDAV